MTQIDAEVVGGMALIVQEQVAWLGRLHATLRTEDAWDAQDLAGMGHDILEVEDEEGGRTLWGEARRRQRAEDDQRAAVQPLVWRKHHLREAQLPDSPARSLVFCAAEGVPARPVHGVPKAAA